MDWVLVAERMLSSQAWLAKQMHPILSSFDILEAAGCLRADSAAEDNGAEDHDMPSRSRCYGARVSRFMHGGCARGGLLSQVT